MAWISWSRTWATRRTTTTSRKSLRCSSKNLRWKRMYLLLQADQRPKQKPRTRTSVCSSTRTIPICEKILDWYWARNLFACRLPSVKSTEYSSSSWSSTSRRRWSDWILEIERWSSVRLWELSTLVWWNVEEYRGKRRRKQEQISILNWSIRTRNSLSPISSRSFRT